MQQRPSPAAIAFAVLCFSLATTPHVLAQTTIKERVEIAPRRSNPARLASNVAWNTVYPGTIIISGDFCTNDSNLTKIMVLQPIQCTIANCGGQYTLPGHWKANTPVSVYVMQNHCYQCGCAEWDPHPWDSYYPDSVKPGWTFIEGVVQSELFMISMGGDPIPTGTTVEADNYYGTDLDHFRVKCTPDSMSYGDTSVVTVTAVDHGDQEVNYGADSLLTFQVDSTRLGSFINLAGALVPSPLNGIRYADAHAGRIKFVSTGPPADSLTKVLVTAYQTTNPSVMGVDTVRIRDPFDLDIVDPAAGVRVDSTISPIPSMPHLSAKAHVTGRRNSSVKYFWSFALKWNHWSPTFKADRSRDTIEWISLDDEWCDTLVVSNSDTCRSLFQWGSDIRGGFIDSLRVTAQCRSRSVTKTRSTPYRILGLDPTKAAVKSGISLKMQVILYKEGMFHQFGKDSLPSYGYPAGYGVAKMDPPTSDQQFWSWTANRAAGVSKYARCVSNALGYGDRIRTAQVFKKKWYSNATDLDTNQQRLDAFQQYNGYHHWYWTPDFPEDENTTGHWIEKPPLKPKSADSTGYGRDAERIYQNILKGQYPPNWN